MVGKSYKDENLKVLKKKDPVLYDKISFFHGDDEDIKIYMSESKNGLGVSVVEKEGKKQYLNSIYNPINEADKFVSQYNEKVIDYSVMVFFGFGNGIISSTLLNNLPEHVKYIFYEPSPNIFMHTLQNFDLKKVLNNERVKVIVKGLNDMYLEAELGKVVNSENYRITFFDALPKYSQLYEKDRNWLRERYEYVVGLIRINIGTSRHFADATAKNDLYNMRYLLGNSSMEEDFENVFPEGATAILVAAGPSLEKNVQQLKRAKGRALIIAVDTSLRYIVSQGIFPDVVVVADPLKPIQLFEDQEVQNCSLAICTSANYKIVELMKGKIIYASSSNAYYNKILCNVGRNMYRLTTGGSVSTVAFSLAIAWGFRRLVLVGQDLALSNDKVHAGDDDIDAFKLKEKHLEVDGYFGETVYTSPDYAEYIKWYETIIRMDDDIEVINATEGGAAIKRTIQMSLKDVVDSYCNHVFDYEGVIKNQRSALDSDEKEIIKKCWVKSIDNLDVLRRKMNECKSEIEKEIKSVKSGRSSYGELKRLHKYVGRLVRECDKIDEICFLDMITAEHTADILSDIYESELDNSDEHIRILDKMSEYMSFMSNAVEEVKLIFEELLTKTSEN